MYPGGTIDLFAGDQVVIVGRYHKGGIARVRLSGQCQGETKTFDFTADLTTTTSADSTNAFVERLWAVRRVGEIIDQLDLQGPNDELVKELVQLSTQHGIMTPYTSFLADENTDLASVAVNAAHAGKRLSLLERQAGQSGFSQRAEKATLMNAAAPLAVATPAEGAPGQVATYRDAETDELVVESRVTQLGDKTFYCRNKQWIDSSITDEEVKTAKRVAQFSDEYFHLASAHGPSLAKCLVSDEPIVVRLGSDVYLIEPQK
jgi:Ca-activated chloride channel family protein